MIKRLIPPELCGRDGSSHDPVQHLPQSFNPSAAKPGSRHRPFTTSDDLVAGSQGVASESAGGPSKPEGYCSDFLGDWSIATIFGIVPLATRCRIPVAAP
jgi:hypothetical protein